MLIAPIPVNENERLESLRVLNILDTPHEERYDRITRLVAKFFQVPVAYVSLVDRNRQWFKSKQGFDICETPRDISFCGHTILRDDTLVIPDATRDPDFADNPVVTGPPGVRFYAGHPLSGPGGYKIGTLCILDMKPKEFGPEKVKELKDFAAMVEHELNLVDALRLQSEFLKTKDQLVQSQNTLAQELAEAAQYVKDLLPAKLKGEVSTDWRFVPSSNLGGDAFGYHWIDKEHFAIYLLDVTGHGVSAALLSISVINALRSESLPLTDFRRPAKVLKVLNDIFQMDLHGNKSFTIWYGVYHRPTHRIVYASAGHPPAILTHGFSPRKASLNRLKNSGIMIGCFPELDYEEESLELGGSSRLLVFSDGIFEIRKTDGSHGSYDDFINILNEWSEGGHELDWLLEKSRKTLGGAEGFFEDDISVVQVCFPKGPCFEKGFKK